MDTLASCKMLLEAEGFLVIPKERVLKLTCRRTAHDSMVSDIENFRQWQEYELAKIGRQMGALIIQDKACTIDTFKLADSDLRSLRPVGSVLEVQARVIIPKEKK